jgi:hypothetical protein
MSVTAAASLGALLLGLLLLFPAWLQRRVTRRIHEQAAEAAVTVPAAAGVHGNGPPAAVTAAPFEGPPAGAVPVTGPLTVPLFDLLAGMTLPCELAPLTNVEPLPVPGVDRLVFVTEWPAERVRADLKGALAGVEFDLAWTGWNEGTATRDGVGFRVVVHPTPDAVTVGSRPAFPTAASGTTVVELAAP